MDTVPGSDVMGGGWLHGIQHGHDLAALAQIGQEHGSEGVIQGLYHIYVGPLARALVERALLAGPDALAAKERRILLLDPERVDELPRRVWELPNGERAHRWRRPGVAP